MAYHLTLFMAGSDFESAELVRLLRDVLTANLSNGEWTLDLVDVLDLPEKALAHDVFVTPTLLRSVPEPVVKILGDISQTQRLLACIRDDVKNQSVIL